MQGKSNGFTLVELMLAMAIAIILMALLTPGLVRLVQNNRMSSLHNDLMSDLAIARSTSVTRGNYATLCASNDAGTQCLPQVIIWTNGWLVFDDKDNDGRIDTGEEILSSKNGISDRLKMFSNNPRVSFDPEGSAFGFATEFAFYDGRGNDAKRGLIVSNSGRSRAAESSEILVNC